MRGYLQGIGKVVPLSVKVTTIGRENCDLIIPNFSVETQHAVIELSELTSRFTLQDLSSTSGTFVNGCRVYGAAVPLSHADQLVFGEGGDTYTFLCDLQSIWDSHSDQQQSRWQHQQRSRPPPAIGGFKRSTSARAFSPRFKLENPHSIALVRPEPVQDQQSASDTRANPAQSADTPLSHSFRAARLMRRPKSAPVVNISVDDIHNRWKGMKGWKSIGGRSYTAQSTSGSLHYQDESGISVIQEKRIVQLTKHNLELENEVAQKDAYIGELQAHVATLDRGKSARTAADDALTQEIEELHVELRRKQDEISSLSEVVERSRTVTPQPPPMATPPDPPEVRELQREIAALKKDILVSKGLTAKLQRELDQKTRAVSRMTQEIEGLQKKLVIREDILSAGTAEKLRACEADNANLQASNDFLRGELEKRAKLMEEHRAVCKELREAQSQVTELQTSERQLRVDLQKALTKPKRGKKS